MIVVITAVDAVPGMEQYNDILHTDPIGALYSDTVVPVPQPPPKKRDGRNDRTPYQLGQELLGLARRVVGDCTTVFMLNYQSEFKNSGKRTAGLDRLAFFALVQVREGGGCGGGVVGGVVKVYGSCIL